MVAQEKEALEVLREELQKRGYSLEVDQEPDTHGFRYTYAVIGEKKQMVCAVSSYYLNSGLQHLSQFLDQWEAETVGLGWSGLLTQRNMESVVTWMRAILRDIENNTETYITGDTIWFGSIPIRVWQFISLEANGEGFTIGNVSISK